MTRGASSQGLSGLAVVRQSSSLCGSSAFLLRVGLGIFCGGCWTGCEAVDSVGGRALTGTYARLLRLLRLLLLPRRRRVLVGLLLHCLLQLQMARLLLLLVRLRLRWPLDCRGCGVP